MVTVQMAAVLTFKRAKVGAPLMGYGDSRVVHGYRSHYLSGQ